MEVALEVATQPWADGIQGFRLALANQLQSVDDPITIQLSACTFLRDRLDVDRVVFVRVLSGSHIATVSVESSRADPVIRTSPLRVFSEGRIGELRAGRSVVVHDVGARSGLEAATEEHHRNLGVGAYVAMPVLERSVWTATIGVHQNAARAWTEEEVALVGEAGQQIWIALVRARHLDGEQ